MSSLMNRKLPYIGSRFKHVMDRLNQNSLFLAFTPSSLRRANIRALLNNNTSRLTQDVSYSHAEQSALAASAFYGGPPAEMTQAPGKSPSTSNPRIKTKRKRDWDSKEEYGDYVKGTRALPVAESLPEDGIPTDGQEYLLAVR